MSYDLGKMVDISMSSRSVFTKYGKQVFFELLDDSRLVSLLQIMPWLWNQVILEKYLHVSYKCVLQIWTTVSPWRAVRSGTNLGGTSKICIISWRKYILRKINNKVRYQENNNCNIRNAIHLLQETFTPQVNSLVKSLDFCICCV